MHVNVLNYFKRGTQSTPHSLRFTFLTARSNKIKPVDSSVKTWHAGNEPPRLLADQHTQRDQPTPLDLHVPTARNRSVGARATDVLCCLGWDGTGVDSRSGTTGQPVRTWEPLQGFRVTRRATCWPCIVINATLKGFTDEPGWAKTTLLTELKALGYFSKWIAVDPCGHDGDPPTPSSGCGT